MEWERDEYSLQFVDAVLRFREPEWMRACACEGVVMVRWREAGPERKLPEEGCSRTSILFVWSLLYWLILVKAVVSSSRRLHLCELETVAVMFLFGRGWVHQLTS